MAAYAAKTGPWIDIQRDLVLLYIWQEVRVTKDQIMRHCFDLFIRTDYENVMKSLHGYLSIVQQSNVWHYTLNQRGKELAAERYTKLTTYATDGI